MIYLEDYIEKGIRKGLDVSWFVREEWDMEQLYDIARGLEDGLDVSIYAKKEFDFGLMEEIRYGLLKEKKG